MARYKKEDFLPIDEADINRILSEEITLTELVQEMEKRATALGKRAYKRTALKDNILKMLDGDDTRKQQFLDVLKSNSKTGGVIQNMPQEEETVITEQSQLEVHPGNYEERKEILFSKLLNKDRKKI